MDILRKAQRNTGTGLRGAGRRDLLAEAIEEERAAKARIVPVSTVTYPEPADLRTWVDADTMRPAYMRNGEVIPYSVEEIAEKRDTEFALGTKVHVFRGALRPGTTVRDGPGSLHYASGESFIGHFRNHVKSGAGISLSPSGYSVEGAYLDDKPHGLCLEAFPGGDAYLGEFFGGLAHGFGVMYYARNGSRHEGQFEAGEKHGKGTVFYENGDIFQGTWKRGLRHGYGITTYAETGRSYSSEWTNDEADFKTKFVRDVVTPRSSAVALDSVVSPLGIDLRTMQPMPDLVEELHPSIFRRVKMAFERLDAECVGEIDLQALRSWWAAAAAHANEGAGGGVLSNGSMTSRSSIALMSESTINVSDEMPNAALLIALQRASANGVTLNLFETIGVLVPKLPEADLRRSMTLELTPETVLRLRGALAGVNAKHQDSFIAMCEAAAPPLGATASSPTGKHQPHAASHQPSVKGSPVVTFERLQSSRSIVGGVRVPHSHFVRAAAIDGTPAGTMTFVQLVKQLYPNLHPGAAERFEVDTLPTTVLKLYARDFERLDQLQQHHLGLERLKAAQRRWQHRRAMEAAAEAAGSPPASPMAGSIGGDVLLAEGFVRPGPFRHVAVWDIGDIPLTVSLARLIDRHRTGWISLLDILRFVYPNVPCLATKERLGQMVRAEEQCQCVLCSFCGDRFTRPKPPSPYADGNSSW